MAAVVCENCGTSNPAGRQFCENCDGFLDWTGTEADPVAAAPPAAAPPAAAPQQQVRPQSAPAQAPQVTAPQYRPQAPPPPPPPPPGPGPAAAPPPHPGAVYAPVAALPVQHGAAAADLCQLRHGERADPPVLPPLRNVARHAERDDARPAGRAGQAAAAPLLGRRPLLRRPDPRHDRVPGPVDLHRPRGARPGDESRRVAPDPPHHGPGRAHPRLRSRVQRDGAGRPRGRISRDPGRLGRRRRPGSRLRHPLDAGRQRRPEVRVRGPSASPGRRELAGV